MKIAIHPYAKEWPVIFRYEDHTLKRALDIPGMCVEHIGSTAVPGLSAKPVIDVLIGIPADYPLDSVVEPLLDVRYIYVPYYENFTPQRRFFIRVDDDSGINKKIIDSKESLVANIGVEQTHIHTVHYDSRFWRDTIKFRDHLRNNPADRLVYELLKKQLAENEWETANDYARAKSNFIEMILSRPA